MFTKRRSNCPDPKKLQVSIRQIGAPILAQAEKKNTSLRQDAVCSHVIDLQRARDEEDRRAQRLVLQCKAKAEEIGTQIPAVLVGSAESHPTWHWALTWIGRGNDTAVLIR